MTERLIFPNLGLEFSLNPTAFQITESWGIQWYGIIITIAFISACAYAYSRAKTFGLIPDSVLDVLMGGVIGGIIGARLYYVIFSWDTYKNNLSGVFKVWEGGLAVYGGIIGGVLVASIICKKRNIKLLPMYDLAAGGIFIGQAIGRWGNFVNIEAFGSNTNSLFGMTSNSITLYLQYYQEKLSANGIIVDPLMPVHPTFLYESFWCIIGFAIIFLYTNHRRFDGELALIYTGWYGLGRFWIESLRTDSLMIGAVKVSQGFALLCFIVSFTVLIVVRVKIKKKNDPNFLKLYVNTDN